MLGRNDGAGYEISLLQSILRVFLWGDANLFRYSKSSSLASSLYRSFQYGLVVGHIAPKDNLPGFQSRFCNGTKIDRCSMLFSM